jgi:hypothetical protein
MNRKTLVTAGLVALIIMSRRDCGGKQPVEKDSMLKISIRSFDATGDVTMELSHSAPEKLRIWKDGNSWGWANWRILVLRSSSVFQINRNPDEGFTRNFPGFDEIEPAQPKTIHLKLNDGSWRCGKESNFRFQKGDEVIVLYSVPQTPEGAAANVWNGTLICYGKI